MKKWKQRSSVFLSIISEPPWYDFFYTRQIQLPVCWTSCKDKVQQSSQRSRYVSQNFSRSLLLFPMSDMCAINNSSFQFFFNSELATTFWYSSWLRLSFRFSVTVFFYSETSITFSGKEASNLSSSILLNASFCEVAQHSCSFSFKNLFYWPFCHSFTLNCDLSETCIAKSYTHHSK